MGLMNIVDVSESAIAQDWRGLLNQHGLDPDCLEMEARVESGEPMPDEAMSDEQLATARQRTEDMVCKWLYRPLRGLFNWKFPNWEVTDEELLELCELYSKVFGKHFPEFSLNPTVQRVDNFVDELGLEIQAVVKTWRFMKKREGIPPTALTESEAKELGNTPKTAGNLSENAPAVRVSSPELQYGKEV